MDALEHALFDELYKHLAIHISYEIAFNCQRAMDRAKEKLLRSSLVFPLEVYLGLVLHVSNYKGLAFLAVQRTKTVGAIQVPPVKN
ncbi:hypothetical protein O6H91_Y191900 [Diphasiastrum complanatum]|nr:hypothetical protein O6H91_Y191900 [Diphasiastrum complanatum]